MLHYFLSYTTTTAHRRLLSGDCSTTAVLLRRALSTTTWRQAPPRHRRRTSPGRRAHGTGHDRCQGAGMYSGPGASFAAGFRAVVAWPKYFLLLEVRVASRSSGVGNLRIVRDC